MPGKGHRDALRQPPPGGGPLRHPAHRLPGRAHHGEDLGREPRRLGNVRQVPALQDVVAPGARSERMLRRLGPGQVPETQLRHAEPALHGTAAVGDQPAQLGHRGHRPRPLAGAEPEGVPERLRQPPDDVLAAGVVPRDHRRQHGSGPVEGGPAFGHPCDADRGNPSALGPESRDQPRGRSPEVLHAHLDQALRRGERGRRRGHCHLRAGGVEQQRLASARAEVESQQQVGAHAPIVSRAGTPWPAPPGAGSGFSVLLLLWGNSQGTRKPGTLRPGRVRGLPALMRGPDAGWRPPPLPWLP